MRQPRRVLYSSAEVRASIIDLFRDGSSRRIAISAFVGDGADAYLPNPKGLHLICSPTPGATNPNVLRELLRREAKVEFVDRLHMKVYWAEGRGAVITSANLSTNAMGMGGLKEAGILLPASEVDIDRLLKQLKPRPAGPELRRLDFKHREYFKRAPRTGTNRKSPSFAEWHELPAREQWKICTFDTFSDNLSDTAVESVKLEFGKRPYNWICGATAPCRVNDRILCIDVKDTKLTHVEWLFVDWVLKVPRSDRNFDRELPYEVIQIHGSKHYIRPPFSIDRHFRDAVQRLLKKGSFDGADEICAPRDGLISSLYKEIA